MFYSKPKQWYACWKRRRTIKLNDTLLIWNTIGSTVQVGGGAAANKAALAEAALDTDGRAHYVMLQPKGDTRVRACTAAIGPLFVLTGALLLGIGRRQGKTKDHQQCKGNDQQEELHFGFVVQERCLRFCGTLTSSIYT